jgi:hypothetical protein
MKKTSEHTILPIESVQERDVDLILLEELSTENSFCNWFIKELNLPEFYSSNGTWRSITDFGLGETDLLFSYNSNNEKIFVLIENKLDATFQNEQFIRYEKRAKQYIEKRHCDNAYCILVAPNLYCENQNDFENYISYETISKLFEKQNTKRGIFRSQLMQIAVEKLRRGYQPVNSEPVQKFWHSYWNFKNDKIPSLTMKKPSIVPHNSDWPMLYDSDLNGIIFYHKLAQGNSDATFQSPTENIELKIKENLPEDFKFIKHSKSFSVRISSEKIDRTKDFKEQVKEVEIGMKNLEKLRDWIKEIGINNWLQHRV